MYINFRAQRDLQNDLLKTYVVSPWNMPLYRNKVLMFVDKVRKELKSLALENISKTGIYNVQTNWKINNWY